MIKALGNSVRNYDQNKWESNNDEIKRYLHAKFSQNDNAREFLLATGNKAIVEATKDKYWGCGKSLQDRCA